VSRRLLDVATGRLADMLDDLAALVGVESPSSDPVALDASARAVAELLRLRTGVAAELVASPAGPHVHWRGGGEPRVLLVGHHDTVHPLGTLAARPFQVRDGHATGPGVFDMKAGIVQAVHAIAMLRSSDGVELLLTCDEEVGSGASRTLIEQRAAAAGAVLVLEPSADGGALKTARKGTGTFDVVVHGRAAHAGLEPDKGVNALVEASRLVLEIAGMGRPELGTTVTPTMAHAGTADNVVPAEARVKVDVRIVEPAEKERLEAGLRSLRPALDGARVEVLGSIGRPPMPATASAALFALAEQVAAEHGLPPLVGAAVGGGSDGNFTAAIGVPTLDGLGAVGGGAHAHHEFVAVDTMPARTALLAGLVQALRHPDRSGPRK
jgi:glutamate carboxypeptidase